MKYIWHRMIICIDEMLYLTVIFEYLVWSIQIEGTVSRLKTLLNLF